MKIDETLLQQATTEFGKMYAFATQGDLTLLQWSIKSIGAVVALPDDLLYVVNKPDIKTKFLFPYGSKGVATEQEKRVATALADAVKVREGFIRANLDEFDKTTNILMGDDLYYFRRSNRGKEPTRLIAIVKDKRYGGVPNGKAPKEYIDLIREEVAKVRKDFEKRLNAYWSRYGSTKLKAGTYLVTF